MSPAAARSRTALGIVLVLLSAVGLAVQNILLRLFFSTSQLFGLVTFGGWVTPLLSNVVLLLALRMAAMAGLLACVAPWFYPKTFVALKTLPQDRPRLGYALGCGLCLFVGLTLLYLALSQVATGIAIATFFVYPAITVLLAWRYLQQRPRRDQLLWMPAIALGVVLTTVGATPSPGANPLLGGLCALGAGLCFGLYGVFAQCCLQPRPPAVALHPIPFSLLVFSLVALLAGGTAWLGQPIAIEPATWPAIAAVTLLGAVLNLIAYVLNNFGIRYIGASLTALLSASTPVLTTLFAWWSLQESLQQQQLLGIALVTVGVATLSLRAGQAD